jgi:hypothetical protein
MSYVSNDGQQTYLIFKTSGLMINILNKKFFSTQPGEINLNKISDRAMYDEVVGSVFDIPDLC